jgi:hypothetical protein
MSEVAPKPIAIIVIPFLLDVDFQMAKLLTTVLALLIPREIGDINSDLYRDL